MKSRGLCVALMLCVAVASANARQTAVASPQPGLTGEWILTISIFGNESSERLQFKTEKGKLSGSVRRRRKEVVFPVKVEGDTVEFIIPGPDGGKQSYTGKVSGGALSGKMVETSSDEWGESPPPDW